VSTLVLGTSTAAVNAGSNFTGVGREKGIGREADASKELTGIILMLFHADFFGHTEVVHRHKHLNLTFQLDDHKNAQSYTNNSLAAGMIKTSGKAAGNSFWDTGAARFAHGFQFGSEADGVSDLAGYLGEVAGGKTLGIIVAAHKVRGEHLDASFAAEKDGFFVVDAQTAYLAGSSDGGESNLQLYCKVDCQLHTVVAAVEGDRFGVDDNIAYFGGFELYSDGIVDQFLIAIGEKHLHVLEALAVAAGVIYAAGIDAYSFFEAVLSGGIISVVRHC